MKFEVSNSHAKVSEKLILELGDPPIDEIRRVFSKYDLELIQGDNSSEFKVTLKQKITLATAIFICTVSRTAYICNNVEQAIKELNLR